MTTTPMTLACCAYWDRLRAALEKARRGREAPPRMAALTPQMFTTSPAGVLVHGLGGGAAHRLPAAAGRAAALNPLNPHFSFLLCRCASPRAWWWRRTWTTRSCWACC
jgi:hypothetical protein